MRSIATYFAERFPLVTVIPVAVGTAIIALGFVSLTPLNWGQALFVAVAFLAFLLRQRVTDEFKDAGHDDENYPNRPVQRGAIRRPTLVALGVCAFVGELAAVIASSWLGGSPFLALWYVPFLVWSALTSVEFFAHRWLNEHFTTYFISHQIIFVWFALWTCAIRGSGTSTTTIVGVVALVLLMAAVEIVRKFEIRRNASGAIVRDTYPAVWGFPGTVTILAALYGSVGGVVWWQSGSVWSAVVAAVAVLVVAFGNLSERSAQLSLVLALFGNALIVGLR